MKLDIPANDNITTLQAAGAYVGGLEDLDYYIGNQV